jgi:crossover junction endodeoxyribonuclease RusA
MSGAGTAGRTGPATKRRRWKTMVIPVTADLLNIVVEGRPYPKGSLRHVGGGRLVEQLTGSDPWRKAVAAAAKRAVVGKPQFPLVKPNAVSVDIHLTFNRPKSTPLGRGPVTRSTGDIDKHCRNILDALTDAGVFEDDSQVTVLFAHKRYVPPEHPESAWIKVRLAA